MRKSLPSRLTLATSCQQITGSFFYSTTVAIQSLMRMALLFVNVGLTARPAIWRVPRRRFWPVVGPGQPFFTLRAQCHCTRRGGIDCFVGQPPGAAFGVRSCHRFRKGWCARQRLRPLGFRTTWHVPGRAARSSADAASADVLLGAVPHGWAGCQLDSWRCQRASSPAR
jgi:hypothetical protein